MEFKSYKNENYLVIQVIGRMDALSAPEFEKACFEHIQQGESTILMDLEKLEYMSSAGLRSILIVGKKLKSVNGSLSFCSLAPNVAHVFAISNFASIFTVHSSLEKALASS